MTSMYYLNIFGGLTKPPASNIWWRMEKIWWLTPPKHLISRALVQTLRRQVFTLYKYINNIFSQEYLLIITFGHFLLKNYF